MSGGGEATAEGLEMSRTPWASWRALPGQDRGSRKLPVSPPWTSRKGSVCREQKAKRVGTLGAPDAQHHDQVEASLDLGQIQLNLVSVFSHLNCSRVPLIPSPPPHMPPSFCFLFSLLFVSWSFHALTWKHMCAQTVVGTKGDDHPLTYGAQT